VVIRKWTSLVFWFNRLMFPRYSCQIDSTKPKKTTRHMAVLAVFGAAAWMLFGNLNYPLFESSETRSAHLALTLIESGDWESPRLSTWAIATSYRIFYARPSFGWFSPCGFGECVSGYVNWIRGVQSLHDRRCVPDNGDNHYVFDWISIGSPWV